eukprot:scaffold10353_cov127-Isochrysis_galbana.AAC.2
MLRASEKLGARSTGYTLQGMMSGGVSDPQTASGAQPGRPTPRSACRRRRAAPMDASTGRKEAD